MVTHHRFYQYELFKGSLPQRINGSLISMGNGPAVAYALDALQERGRFFVAPGEPLYTGQIVGEHTRDDDLVVNPQKAKQLTNVRASGTDKKAHLAPPIKMSMEELLEYVANDECVEITPKSLRLRKLLLDENARKRQAKRRLDF